MAGNASGQDRQTHCLCGDLGCFRCCRGVGGLVFGPPRLQGQESLSEGLSYFPSPIWAAATTTE